MTSCVHSRVSQFTGLLSSAYTHLKNVASFFSKLYTQIQQLHTEWKMPHKQIFVLRCKHLWLWIQNYTVQKTY